MKRTSPFPRFLKHTLPMLSIVALLLQAAPWDANWAVAEPALPAVNNTLYLDLVNARTEPLAFDGAGVTQGDPISSTIPYQWLISVDNTGDPLQPRDAGCSRDDPDYPANCDWPSIRTIPGWAPVYTQGDQDDLNGTTGVTLPAGKYLISVVAEGYKIGGQHFTVPLADPGLLTVGLQPLPLPPATMRIAVFEDISMTNGQFDAPVEHGLAGFRAVVNDTIGEVTQDLFGNPLCTVYQKDGSGNVVLDGNGDPIVQTLGNGCYSDANGDITIPNLAPLRYDVFVVPPDGTAWTETTTLEGSWSWDTWLQEGGTGLDNEFVVAGEPFPWTVFGFVSPTLSLTPTVGAGAIQGAIVDVEVFTPFQGGLPYQGGVWGGLAGSKIVGPIEYPWIALNDLQNGDTAIYVGQGNADGTFNIPNVPPGNYVLTYWDHNLHRILDWVQVTVQPNQTTDVGALFLTGWFTIVHGSVFVDANSNGRRDPGEAGVPNYLVVLKDRDNTEIDRMSIAVTTEVDGSYVFEKAYPMGSWMVLEAYNDAYYTTGYTFQATNQPEETTVMGAGVDVGFLPILGQSVRLDWGVRPYDVGTNGGVVGTVFYDTARNELDARYAVPEPFGPGIPDLTVNLYATLKDTNGNFITVTTPGPDFGALVKGHLLNTTTTETYARQQNCQARDVDGNPVDAPALAPPTGNHDCLEGPVMGVQIGTEFNTLDGNYGFTEILTDTITGLALPAPAPIPPGDYLVEVVVPDDPVFGRPLYQVTREEDINVFGGDTYVPQIPPPACAGPLHTVDVAGVGSDGPDAVYNPAFAEAGGSIYEGQAMPLCDVKLVTVTDRRSVAPPFMFFTKVAIPGRWKGYIIDDLTLSTDPNELFFGEKAGLAYMPIGIYDFSNRLIVTVISDPNGVYEVLMPSSSTYNAPTPSGIAANVYYQMGNDPGQPGNPNPTYNPQYRTIGTSFEIYPGTWLPADLAPTQIAVSIQAPGAQFNQVAQCRLEETTPQLYAVSQPYVVVSGTVTIHGLGFGASQGGGSVTLDGAPLPVLGWSDRTITATVPDTTAAGVYQLAITADNGEQTVNGLSFHVLGAGYNPTLFEVGPTLPYTTIQSALDAAAPISQSLVVVYPGAQVPLTNPLGIYYENIVVYAPVKLQGIGPGGVYSDTVVTTVPGSIIDGRTVGGDTPYSAWWRQQVGDIWLNRGGWDGSSVDGDGNPLIYEGATVYLLANDGEFTAAFKAAIDGFAIQGGDQQGFPNNINFIGGEQIPGI
ncbi:MAG: IPT/TIG domain-containing protein, partial [Anaerolineae bacterium]|nr:IPT/TIG domain-containing protein [Anaerolineae bacterium]